MADQDKKSKPWSGCDGNGGWWDTLADEVFGDVRPVANEVVVPPVLPRVRY